MPIEVRPLGVSCNIGCKYCYQEPQRQSENRTKSYDLELIKEAILLEKRAGPFLLFGGEPLLVRIEDLEKLWAWGLEEFGSNGVQTNGTCISEEHILLFKKYRVHVGISIDGPCELNDLRWSGSLQGTRSATARTEKAIDDLCKENIRPSLIVTLHRVNASEEKLPILVKWFRDLDCKGIRSVRLHVLESENNHIRAVYGLSSEENIKALTTLGDLEKSLVSVRFDIFREVRELLLANDRKATCVWRGCDSYNTQAVRGVEGFGQRSNCGRTNKNGINFVKSPDPGYERYIALYNTPQEDGGCSGCRFFLMCKGQCPGTSIDGDWRNRSEFCEVWKALFEREEQALLEEGEEPVSLSAQLLRYEQAMVRFWMSGRNIALHELCKKTQLVSQIEPIS